MRNIRSSKPLVALLRMAILGITQGAVTLVAVLMWLCGCGARALIGVMLAFAVVGIATGSRATRPKELGGMGPSRPGTPHGPSAPRDFASAKNQILA